ncbi:hypothetical protein LEP1GSC088_4506 [Leptospira interrogans str. L1207]|nr:hypothetical protein LEP1GSC088_4506 [Leptospira interrogans str. L1207]
MIHFFEKNWGLESADFFLKCGNYHRVNFLLPSEIRSLSTKL